MLLVQCLRVLDSLQVVRETCGSQKLVGVRSFRHIFLPRCDLLEHVEYNLLFCSINVGADQSAKLAILSLKLLQHDAVRSLSGWNGQEPVACALRCSDVFIHIETRTNLQLKALRLLW